jgi:D-alanine-D-alanine ligase
MLIGLTYDLRDAYLAEGYSELETAEFDRADTIEAIEGALRQLSHRTERIGNIRDLVRRFSDDRPWDMIFNICEGMFGDAREAQVPALLDAYRIPYVFSSPLVLAVTLDKGHTKRILRDFGIPTADFRVIGKTSDLQNLTLKFPLFAKPVAEGTGKGINAHSIIHSKDHLKDQCTYILEELKQPVLIETYLPGREFTVGIIGSGDEAEAIGTLEVKLRDHAVERTYSYENKEKCEELVDYLLCEEELTHDVEEIALQSWKALNCLDGGRVDIKLDDQGKPFFLEVNPLAGLHPLHSDLPILAAKKGMSYVELINRILDSAIKRYFCRH